MQIVNVVFWMLPHAVILSVSCSWFGVIVNVSGLIRWTMWNTVSDALSMWHQKPPEHSNTYCLKYALNEIRKPFVMCKVQCSMCADTCRAMYTTC